MEALTPQDRAEPQTFDIRYQKLLDNDNYLKKENNGTKKILFFLAAGWTGEGSFKQTVSVEGITAEDVPVPAFVDDGGNEAESKAKKEKHMVVLHILKAAMEL